MSAGGTLLISLLRVIEVSLAVIVFEPLFVKTAGLHTFRAVLRPGFSVVERSGEAFMSRTFVNSQIIS
jgi:hypothetical protein